MYQCEKCGGLKYYEEFPYKWCKPCLINDLKANFTKTSGNEKIDNFIQEMQLKINDTPDIIFEWVPYNQFNDIKVINKDAFTTIHSAIWKDGPLYYDDNKEEYLRRPDKKVTLKCLHNSQNISSEFLNEV